MSNTDKLRYLAEVAIKEGRKDLEKSGGVTPRFFVDEADGTLKMFVLDGKAGDVLNVGRAKTALFGIVRKYVQDHNCAGVAILTEAWRGRTTDKGEELYKSDRKKFDELSGAHGMEDMVKAGYITRTECIMMCAQNAEDVIIMWQNFERDERLKLITFGAVEEDRLKQSELRGRQKMYGDLRPENLR